ncbi:MAG TPA: hypothetical protein VFA12_05450 [Stellaceae bacterium]|nr:hypothetical protein [Stellaceae bacterium]
MNLLGFLLARLKEPSSYAGLGMILAAFGVTPSDGTMQAIVQLCVAVAGLAAVLAPESKSGGPPTGGGSMAPVLALVVAASLALSACGAAGTAAIAGSAVTAAAEAGQLVAATDRVIDKACAEYKKGRAVADAAASFGLLPQAALAKISAIESYGDAACANQPAGDPVATAIWVGELIGDVKTLIGGRSGANAS